MTHENEDETLNEEELALVKRVNPELYGIIMAVRERRNG